MNKAFVNIKTLEPKTPVGIKAIGVSYPRSIKVNDFVLLQDILNHAELREYIVTNASITIKNHKDELITDGFPGIQNYLKAGKDEAADLIAVNFPKPVLQKIAREHDISDYRLIASGFDPYYKLRDRRSFHHDLLDILLGTKPDSVTDNSPPNDLHETISKNLGTSNLYFLPYHETIIDLMKKAYDSLNSRIGAKNQRFSQVIISTLTPHNIYKGAKGVVCFSDYRKISDHFEMIPVTELHEGCIGFLQVAKMVTLFSPFIDANDVLGITGDTLASISGSDWKCRGLSSDGATAVLFGKCEEGYGILGGSNFNIPSLHNIITEDQLAGGLLMNGTAIYKAITEYYPALVTHAIKTFQFDRSKVKIISHQMNGAIISRLHQILNKDKPVGEPEIHEDQIVNTIKLYGNSSSSTIPTALYQSLIDKQFKKGDELLFIALGSGFNMGYVGYRVNEELLEYYS